MGRGYEPGEVLELMTASLRSVNKPQKPTRGGHLKCAFPSLVPERTCACTPSILITGVSDEVLNPHFH